MSQDELLLFLRKGRKSQLELLDFLEDADSIADSGFSVHDGRLPTSTGSDWKLFDCSPIRGLEVKSKVNFTPEGIHLQWRTKGDAPKGAVWLKVICGHTEIAPRHFELGAAVDNWQDKTIPADHLQFDLLRTPWHIDFLFQPIKE
jgi:hypothetical protein